MMLKMGERVMQAVCVLITLVNGETIEVTGDVALPKKKRGRPRKNQVAVVEPPVESDVVTVEPVATEPITEQPTTEKPKRGGRRRHNDKFLKIPLEQCEGVGSYEGPDKVCDVAILSHGTKNERTWYKLAFVSKDNEFAIHNNGGFFAKDGKLKDIHWFV
jgi:ribosomal protein L32